MYNNNSKTAEPVVDVNDVSRISSGTVVTGDIFSQKDIRIDGTVNGKICSDGKVVIGEKALIKGSVICVTLDVCGKVDAEFFVKEIFSAKSTADVSGTIKAKKIQVELGAHVNGDCKMITEEEFEKAIGKKPATPAVNAPVNNGAGNGTGNNTGNQK